MSLKPSVRFKIFERDKFCCAYCGKTPPSVILHADHILPKSKGGKDDESNLITSCSECNQGKGASLLTSERHPAPTKEVMEILQERKKQANAYEKYLNKEKEATLKAVQEIELVFRKYFSDKYFTEVFVELTVKRFLGFLPVSIICDCMALACLKIPSDPERAISYFCGICWNKIKKD